MSTILKPCSQGQHEFEAINVNGHIIRFCKKCDDISKFMFNPNGLHRWLHLPFHSCIEALDDILDDILDDAEEVSEADALRRMLLPEF